MAMGGSGLAASATSSPVDDEVIEPIPTSNALPPSTAAAQSEALSALQNLGYGPGDAAGAVAEAAGVAPDAATAELIRAALKLLAPKG